MPRSQLPQDWSGSSRRLDRLFDVVVESQSTGVLSARGMNRITVVNGVTILGLGYSRSASTVLPTETAIAVKPLLTGPNFSL